MPYPASAVAVVDSEVWKCPHDEFVNLLRDNFEIHLHLTEVLSGRLIYKSIMLTEIAVEEAEHRLTTLIEYFRRDEPKAKLGEPFRVPFTRQQLADMTGLRVETVIRSIKSMEQKGLLRLDEGGKILWNSINTSQKG
jgi:CRP-like cAMP-binding protein